jgi:hypothetical protein
MKKVLSAVVLSAAVVASAGQAHAYGDFNIWDGVRGTLVGVIYTDSTEIVLNLGNFKTTNNSTSFQHQFTDENKELTATTNGFGVANFDYKQILADRNDTGAVHVAFYLDDMVSAAITPRVWNAYYTTTSTTNGGEAAELVDYFVNFNYQSAQFLSQIQPEGVATSDVVVSTGNLFNTTLNADGVGSYGYINAASQAFGILNLDEYTTQCEIDLTLWGTRYDTIDTDDFSDDLASSLGAVATLRFDQRTGAVTLNATGEPEACAPVPVPAAAWLLGSGVLGLFGLRRRK